jgi:ATP/maltotriose-dependent transcriptional regulator MalT/DNA-binding SARP family transcriptional activator
MAAAVGSDARRAPTRSVDAKTRPPRLPHDYVERARLLDWLDGALSRRLTTVVAGPGYGKTTLLAAWAERAGAAWYTVDSRDRSLARFARGLSDALGLDRAPELGQAGSDTRAHALAELLCEAVATCLEADTALILDDVHELSAKRASALLLETLCRQAPEQLHVVIGSRREPPFPIQRLRGRGQVLSIDADALALTEDEVGLLVPSSEFAPRIFKLTEGWPAAVRLAADALREPGARDANAVVSRLATPDGPLFAYLAEEVFAREPPTVRDLLRAVAPLERFSLDLCEHLQVPRAPEALGRLHGRGLFVHTDDGEFYVLHALVREFVLAHWPPTDAERRDVHVRAATWLAQRGDVTEALREAVAAGDTSLVARLLTEWGETLLQQGSTREVLEASALLHQSERSPALQQLVGDAYALTDVWDKAGACYARAAGDDYELPAALAWRIGRVHWERGENDEALAAFRRGRLDRSDPEQEAFLLVWWTIAEWNRGEIAEAGSLAERAHERAQMSGDRRTLAWAHHASSFVALGRDERAYAEHAHLALQLAEEIGDLQLSIRARGLLAASKPPAEAIALIEPSIRLVELVGAGAYVSGPLHARGNNHYRLGQLDAAIGDFERALQITERIGSLRQSWALGGLGHAARERGDLARARLVYERALGMIDERPESQGDMWAPAGLARVVVAEDPERALVLAERAVLAARKIPFLASEGLVSAGWVYLTTGDVARARRCADEAERLARQGQPWLPEALEIRALASADREETQRLLREALNLWHDIGNLLEVAKAEYALARLADPLNVRAAARAKRNLRSLGVRDSAAGAAGLLMALGPERPPALEVRALGGFRLYRDGTVVPNSAWQSRKARDLFKLLVARAGRSTTREALIESLWPEDDPARTANRLSVALSVLRTVLDPGHEHAHEHYLRTGRDAIALQPGRIVCDIDGFLAEAEAGLAAARAGRREEAFELLEAAEAGYGGDFAEDDLYEEWAIGPREELRATYLAVTRTLAHLSTDPHVANRYLVRLLERDPYDEGAHLARIRALERAHAYGEARRAYRAYATRMEEIGVEPEPYPSTQTRTSVS